MKDEILTNELKQAIKEMEASFNELQTALRESKDWMSQHIQQEFIWAQASEIVN